MTVPTGSPSSAAVNCPGFSPLTNWISRDVARAQHQLEHRALDHQVVEVALEQVLHADARDVRRALVLLRIGGEQPVLVLDVDHLARAEHLGDQEAAGVGALRRNAPDQRVALPQLVGRHALADHRAALHQVVRQRREAFRLEERDAVLAPAGNAASARSATRPRCRARSARRPAGRDRSPGCRRGARACRRRCRGSSCGAAGWRRSRRPPDRPRRGRDP